MMQELLDVTTKYAMGEEAILANFSGKGKTIVSTAKGVVMMRPTWQTSIEIRRRVTRSIAVWRWWWRASKPLELSPSGGANIVSYHEQMVVPNKTFFTNLLDDLVQVLLSKEPPHHPLQKAPNTLY
jgi:hypothetical protein